MPPPEWLVAAWSNQVTTVANPWIGHTVIVQTSAITSTPTWYVNNVEYLLSPAFGAYYHNLGTSTVSTTLPPVFRTRFVEYTSAVSDPAVITPQTRQSRAEILVRGRASLERSMKLFRKFRPREELDAFLEGREVLICGKLFNYRVHKSRDPLEHTISPHSPHVPYRLELLEKSGRVRASGCVIVPSTPVIDQLLALILHAEDPEGERHLLLTTNWSPPLSLDVGPPIVPTLRDAA